MYVYYSDAAWKNTYVCVYIIEFLFSRQLFENMDAYFLSYQAAQQTWIVMALNALPNLFQACP